MYAAVQYKVPVETGELMLGLGLGRLNLANLLITFSGCLTAHFVAVGFIVFIILDVCSG